MYHVSVMPLEVSNCLVNKLDGLYVECTLGGGGHTAYLLEKFPNIKIIAFDCDEDAYKQFVENKKCFNNRVTFIKDNFKNIKQALSNIDVYKVDGILADIGVSSKQLDDLSRGFSFNANVLDMRMDSKNPLTAKEIINTYSSKDLADIFYKYGQEYMARQLANAICVRRQRGIINTAVELQDIVCSVKRQESRINPATKVFQALRIFVNKELSNLELLLLQAPEILNSQGRIVIISFHSLEDRIVKLNFKQNADNKIYKLLTKKVITAAYEEVKANPRSRSSKIRACEKINV